MEKKQKVERIHFCLSLPKEVMEKVEDARWAARTSRSKFITEVLRQHLEKETTKQ